jgi:hypothetical protein
VPTACTLFRCWPPDALRFLNHAQAGSLADELTFPRQITNDPALHGLLDAITSVVADGIHHAAKPAVGITWP